jgi:hypothetical protein
MFVLDEGVVGLIKALVDAILAGGEKKPVVPKGLRKDVVDLLTRLLALNGDLLDAYCKAIIAERKHRGVHRLLLMRPGEKIPHWEITQRGFAWICDDLLADLAIHPHSLRALADFLYNSLDPDTPGKWFFDALYREKAARAKV